MRAIRFDRTGGPEVLRVVDVPVPEPGPGQVRIRHEAIGLNYIDTYHRSGLYSVSLPSGLGLEAAGVIDAVGSDVSRLRVGDRAAYASGPIGAYAESHVVPASKVVKLPDDISTSLAATVLLKGMTAEFLLRRCYRLKSGDTVLVQAAAGGVGSILSQWAKALGATVIGTVGSEHKAAMALSNGCDHVLPHGESGVVARVRALTGGKGVDVAFDGVGASTFEQTLGCIRPRGWLVSFGNASGPIPPFAPLVLTQRGSLFFTRPSLADYVATTEELEASASALFDAIRNSSVKIHADSTWPFEEAAMAHAALQSRSTSGMCLLTINR